MVSNKQVKGSTGILKPIEQLMRTISVLSQITHNTTPSTKGVGSVEGFLEKIGSNYERGARRPIFCMVLKMMFS